MFKKRLRLLYLLLCAALLLIALRLFYFQVLQVTDVDPSFRLLPRPDWKEMAPPRGDIRDRNGVLLATDRAVLDLAVMYDRLLPPLTRAAGMRIPTGQVIGIESWLDEACSLTGEPVEAVLDRRDRIVERVQTIRRTVLRRAARSGRRIRRVLEETIPHTLISDIPFELAARVEANPERFPGAIIRSGTAREYPQERLASHVIGYVVEARRPEDGGPIRGDPTIVPGDRIGELGAERQFDKALRGVPGYYEIEVDRLTGAARRDVMFAAQPGKTAFLTLDAQAQTATEAAFGEAHGGAVVMDVRSGAILVMASLPTFDNNDIASAFERSAEHPELKLFLSRAMRDSVPSGSVIKPIVALAAADAGAVTPHTRFTCTGVMRLGRREARCAGRHGTLNMTEAIEHSCNIWFYNAGLKAGPHGIVKMARAFGWGEKTGVDLPWEWAGRLPSPGPGWYPGHTLNLSIGQGSLMVTPLQVAVAMAAIANGGDVLRPRVLLRMEPEETDSPVAPSRIARRLDLPAAALAAVREGMRRVPRTGTARLVPGLDTLNVAAKTGTAETPDPEVNHAWIVGFVPADRPRYSFAVVVHNTPAHGAEAAGPIAAEMLAALLQEQP